MPLGKQVSARRGGSGLSLTVNFKPALSREQVEARLQREFDAAGTRGIGEVLLKLLPRRAAPVFVDISGIPGSRRGADMTKIERDTLVNLLTDMRFEVRGVRPLEEAIVTAGGVSLKEIDPKTMESKVAPGLYVCGELLDLDAGTGGFNLQAAFSTGYVAGENAARG